MCNTKWDEHDGYQNTAETWEENVGHKIVIWRVQRCQCGKRTNDVKDGERPAE